jgi:hypothetical protein
MPCISSARAELHQSTQLDGDCTAAAGGCRCDSSRSGVRIHHLGYRRRSADLPISRSDETPPYGTKLHSVDRCKEGGAFYTLYPRGRGASAGSAPNGYAKVSRWASPEEAGAWLSNCGTAIPSGIGGDRLYVALPWARQPGGTGPVRVDFAVPQSALIRMGNAAWRVILQPIQSTPIHNVILTVPNGVTLSNGE